MPDFSYVALDLRGQKIAGVLNAPTERELVNLLSAKSLFPLTVKADDSAAKTAANKRVKGQLMAVFYGQLGSLLKSGVPLLRSLAVLRDQTSDKTLQVVLSEVHGQVEEGVAIADAMKRYPKVFSDISVNMVRAGSEGGFLEDSLERVAQFTEQQEEIKGRAIGAMAYPILIMGAGSTIVAVLMIFFVPMFAEMFDDLRKAGKLPILTQGLLFVSDSLRNYGLFILLGGVGAYFVIKSRLDTEEGRTWIDTWSLKVPMMGPIFQSFAVARLCRVLGTLLKNGVPILKSLEISREAAGNRVLSQAIADASENITAGASLAKPLAASGQFPKTVVEMIAVAEESNSLDRVLVEIADSLEKRTMQRLDLFVRLLEPVMLVLLAGVVLVVVIALLTPMMSMGETI